MQILLHKQTAFTNNFKAESSIFFGNIQSGKWFENSVFVIDDRKQLGSISNNMQSIEKQIDSKRRVQKKSNGNNINLNIDFCISTDNRAYCVRAIFIIFTFSLM